MANHNIAKIERGKNQVNNRVMKSRNDRLLAAPETSGRLSTSVQRFDFWYCLVTSVSYDWTMVSQITVNQLKLAKITQTIPDILASNASAQSSRSFWSGQLLVCNQFPEANEKSFVTCYPTWRLVRQLQTKNLMNI